MSNSEKTGPGTVVAHYNNSALGDVPEIFPEDIFPDGITSCDGWRPANKDDVKAYVMNVGW